MPTKIIRSSPKASIVLLYAKYNNTCTVQGGHKKCPTSLNFSKMLIIRPISLKPSLNFPPTKGKQKHFKPRSVKSCSCRLKWSPRPSPRPSAPL
jgi:hypothetical protein